MNINFVDFDIGNANENNSQKSVLRTSKKYWNSIFSLVFLSIFVTPR